MNDEPMNDESAGGVVCMYSPFPSGGMPRYVAELLDAIAADGSGGPAVEWVSSKDLEPRFRSDRYAVHTVLPRLRERIAFRTDLGWALSRVAHYVRRERAFLDWLRTRPDVVGVHIQEAPPAIAHLVVRSLRRRGVAVFFTVHNVRPHAYPGFVPPTVADRSLRRAYLDADCLFVHSEALATELERFLDRPAGAVTPRVRVVDHGMWTVEGGGPPDAGTLARRLRERRLLCFGTIRRNKGVHLLLDAAARGLLDGVRITVAGEVSDPDYVETTLVPLAQRARAAGVPVELRTGFVPDAEVEHLFATQSALVLPYTAEFVAQSGAAFMGLAHGLPVIATPSGGLAELMAGHRIGVPAARAAPEAVADAVLGLLATDGPGIAALAKGMRVASAALGWGGMAAGTLAEYRVATGTARSSSLPAGEVR